MNDLRRICFKSYPFINNLLPILDGYWSSKILHNKHRIKYNKMSWKTFDGIMHCGGVSYLLSYYLQENDYYNTLTTTEKGCFNSKKTHSYLVHNYHIIDPTYRQMFLPDYSTVDNIHGNDEYHKHLFEKEPFVFIGTYSELIHKYNELNKLHEKVYNGLSLENKLDMWQDGKDESHKCDLDKVINDLSYATLKGRQYMKLHVHLKCNLHNYM